MTSRPSLIVLLLCTAFTSIADLPRNHSPEELERWFNSNDDETPPALRPENINEGQLTFLRSRPAIPPHVAHNRIQILNSSLTDGWVILRQCHTQLDKMPAAQIVYRNHPTRSLRITGQRDIGQAWIENNSVQLKQIGAQASICIEAEIQALHRRQAGQWQLVSGPYQRQFLDGYFPVDLTLEVSFPANLQLLRHEPALQAGLSVTQQAGVVTLRSLFEGVMVTRFDFAAKPGVKQGS